MGNGLVLLIQAMLQGFEAGVLIVEFALQPVDQFMILFGVAFQFFDGGSLPGNFLALCQK